MRLQQNRPVLARDEMNFEFSERQLFPNDLVLGVC